MKVEFNMNSYGEWYWIVPNEAEGTRTYTRQRDAVRGFKRFLARMGVV